jgi:uncharacterized radical SAM superfamily Fe-S cluster-containing enzyme
MKKDEKKKRDYTYYDLTQSLCRKCKKLIDAQIIFRDGRVYMRAICPEHGVSEALIASDVNWYIKVINTRQVNDKPGQFSKKIDKGCPFDCGLCEWHEKACTTPIIPVTNTCNLNCKWCYTINRNTAEYFMSVDEAKERLDWLIESDKQVDSINITGGEPTLHPRLFELIRIYGRKEIGRISLYTNGLKIAEDEEITKRLAEQNINVNLSFNTLDRKTAEKMYGADVLDLKIKALDSLEKYNVPTSLLFLMVKNLNDQEIGRIIDQLFARDFIKNIKIHPTPFNTPGKNAIIPTPNIPLDGVIDKIAKKSNKRIRHDDFIPLPGFHPLCYSVCLIGFDNDLILPLKRLFANDEYSQLLGNKYLLQLDENSQEILKNKIAEISASRKGYPRSKKIIPLLEKMIRALYPENTSLSLFERQKKAEKFIKSIYIHALMNEDTFDASRIVRCGNHVHKHDNTCIPLCSYHLIYQNNAKLTRTEAK